MGIQINFGGLIPMNKTMMNKRIVAIVAIVALVAILGICLVACNGQNDYVSRLKKAGYEVESMKADGEDGEFLKEEGIEWYVSAGKGVEYVSICKFKKESDAKKAESSAKEGMEGREGYAVKRSGSVVIAGTKQGVKDAQ